ncbi:transporter substrate-binding domain-containing protein [Pelagibacterium halotolerans]|uniref:Glutamate aspartate periplasmic binding protein GltI n=1 Tax=Pelagibacterium halotolerans (strain DSM 22347 / JCM 15775 / CGMCC 1.7692 / B2) TaxID=1082931 RepID=G4RD35_PELHB|nr:transporter substrate-binding domain-containing protein [Pelagibacterium halotolerans]AEQ53785.1 glutamate aspartate periplasmic binding protein precursor GltI [Pelagibacterium halotolerans B2]QJR20056.1 transporter substrate-binding domain-containing protein [Pelagibacterium halotolerans]SEA80970.1 general L-amino acid transport system substrate-binding protein [Pelagibacterium halotolerans]
MRKFVLPSLALLSMAVAGQPALAAPGDTLQGVKERGVLNCTGGDGSNPGMAELDDQGNWQGIDIELCRALAAAIFGNPDAVDIVPISWAQRWPALQSGDVDVIVKSSGGTFSRDTELGFQFSNTYFLGTSNLLARADLGLESLADADGGSVCVLAASSQEKQISSYAERLGIELETITMGNQEELRSAFFSARCDVYIDFGAGTAITHLAADNYDDYVALPDVVALEPQVMIVRQGDDPWLDVVNWTLSAVLFAEQEGVSSENVDEMRDNPPTAEVAKLLGVTPGFGAPLGLEDDWAYNVIKHVGNYAEIYDRSLGEDSSYRMARGLNALWTDGGVLFPYVVD